MAFYNEREPRAGSDGFVIILSKNCNFLITMFGFAGKGFTKLYKSSLQSHGRLATTYFRFKRPMGLSLKFREIVRRTNTPFLIALKAPAGKTDFSSEVNINISIFDQPK